MLPVEAAGALEGPPAGARGGGTRTAAHLRHGGAPGGGWRRMGLQQGFGYVAGQPWLVAEGQGLVQGAAGGPER